MPLRGLAALLLLGGIVYALLSGNWGLQSLEQSAKAYPEDHDMRVLVEGLHIDQALRAVEEYIRTLQEALIHPRGT